MEQNSIDARSSEQMPVDAVLPLSEGNAEIPGNESTSPEKEPPTPKKRHISSSEKVSYILGMSALFMFVGMINNYRGDYLNNIIRLSKSNQQILNIVTTVVGYLIGFFVTHYIDNYRGKRGKFRPLALVSAIPFALFGFLMFYTPFKNANSAGAMVYIVGVVLIYNVLSTFAHTANSVAIVMTPDESERNSLFSINSFFTSIMTSAPLVIIAVLGIFQYKYDEAGTVISGAYSKNMMYIIALALCAVVYACLMVNAMLKARERLPYLKTRASLFEGIRDILKNKNFWWLTISNQTRNIYHMGTAFGIYVAGALLGDTSKFLLLGLPTGIGTFVGMLLVQKLIKKTDPIKVYWIFGLYSLVANTVAFVVGYFYLQTGGVALQVLFLFFLFTIGLQFGANNIIPNIFNADLLNELELQTKGKRLEQTIGFTQGIFGTVMGVVTGLVGPWLLLTVCGYQQGDNVVQSQSTSIKLLFFYTVFVGIFFAVSLIPLIGYRLNAKRRAEINARLEIDRAERAAGVEE